VRLAGACIAGAGLLLALAAPADAVIQAAVTLEGPNQYVAEFGGVAMAEDGSGGLVYLKDVGGVARVFVARYVEDHWLAPIEVDPSAPRDASWARIGAADGGELVVVWATPFGTVDGRPLYELESALLGPGATVFEEPVILDPDIGEAVGTSPDLAMNTTGQAYLVYRVTEPFALTPRLRTGDVPEQVRLARFRGRRWSLLSAVNRDAGISMRAPTEANAPVVAINRTGSGLVVWQEPEINGIARIWARRLFGNNVDYVLPVTATSYNGQPITEDTEAPSVAMTLLGGAWVAYRQSAGQGSPLGGPRIFLNKLPDGESESGAEFKGAFLASAKVAGGDGGEVGAPSVDVDEHQEMRLLYDSDGTPQVIEGNDRGQIVGTPTLGPAASGGEEPSVGVMNPEGGGVSAWPSTNPLGTPAVAVREDFPNGAVQTGLVAGGAGGPISKLAVGRSGLGDGLVAFQQGAVGNAAIVATEVSAPPAPLVLSAPKGWIKPSQAQVSWLPAESANEPVTYQVVLDGHVIASAGTALRATISPRLLGDGSHELQVLATDAWGEQTLSAPARLLISGRIPTVSLTRSRSHSQITIRVSDAQSGVDASAVSVSFGDGRSASGRTVFTHTYAHAGAYRVRVHVRDNAGNSGVVSIRVSVS
jgi:hypothetical protein